MDENSIKVKHRVAMSSVIAALLLTGMKLVVGLATNSLGILSEAVHSGVDLGAALMTLFAVNLSDKAADETHHYGHGKMEGLSAFIEVLLLLITCGYIIYEAAARLIGEAKAIEVNIYSFAVMGISIVVDISRSTALYRTAKKYKSQALEADALHFSSDIFTSLVVILGLIGYKYFEFEMADALSALVVSTLVIVVSIRLALRTVDILLDRAPAGIHQKIKDEVSQIPQIINITHLRIRSSGNKIFADMRITVASSLLIHNAHEIANMAEKKVTELIPDADVVVHIDPESNVDECRRHRDAITKLIKDHGDMLDGYHNLSIIHYQNNYLIDFHLVMKGDIQLADAHKVCDHLERDIKLKVKRARVTIHVEPGEKILDAPT